MRARSFEARRAATVGYPGARGDSAGGAARAVGAPEELEELRRVRVANHVARVGGALFRRRVAAGERRRRHAAAAPTCEQDHRPISLQREGGAQPRARQLRVVPLEVVLEHERKRPSAADAAAAAGRLRARDDSLQRRHV